MEEENEEGWREGWSACLLGDGSHAGSQLLGARKEYFINPPRLGAAMGKREGGVEGKVAKPCRTRPQCGESVRCRLSQCRRRFQPSVPVPAASAAAGDCTGLHGTALHTTRVQLQLPALPSVQPEPEQGRKAPLVRPRAWPLRALTNGRVATRAWWRMGRLSRYEPVVPILLPSD